MSTLTLQPLSPDLALPWSPDEQQEQLFKRWVRNALVILLLLFIAVPFLPVFEPDYINKEEKIVKTKVILDSIKTPPKPKPVQKIKPTSKPKPKLKAKPKPKPKPKPKQKPEAKRNYSKTKAVNNKAASKIVSKPIDRKKALQQSAGLSKVSAELNALRGSLNLAGMKNKKATHKGQGIVATANRNVLGENRATKASFGNNIDDASMKSSSVRLASHKATSVKSTQDVSQPIGSQEYGSYKAGQRDMESIRRIFEAKKSAVYALYNETLNEYPELHGKFIFKLVIEAEGHVTNLALVSSELGIPDLEKRILSRIRKINFGKADVLATSVEYKFVFFPS